MSEFRWTAEQARAITSDVDALLVASAGTGKTTTIVGKILWLLGLDLGLDQSDKPLPPCPRPCRIDEIAAITFTEKAAYDLKRKLRTEIETSAPGRRLRWDLDRAAVGTIHAFSGELLREHALRLGIDPGFHVIDEREAQLELDEVIRQVVFQALGRGNMGAEQLVRKYGLTGHAYSSGAVGYVRAAVRDLRWYADRHARWSRDGRLDIERLRELSAGTWTLGEDDVAALACQAVYDLAGETVRRWERFLRVENLRDFDSLILDARALLTDPASASTVDSIRRRFRILIIDEFQDTDAAQRDIAFAIGRGVERPQLLLVGDPKQSIYRFRGADISVWNEVAAQLQDNGEVVDLTHNFRSAPGVITIVNEVCGHAMHSAAREIAAEFPGERVPFTPLVPARRGAAAAGVEWLVPEGRWVWERRRSESELVARRIRQLVESERVIDPLTEEERPCAYRDIAVLYRNRAGIEVYEEALRRHGVPYYQAAGSGFGDRQEILDLLTVLRLVENHRDDLRGLAYLRSPFVGLRDEVIARLRMDGRGESLLQQARDYLENGKWYEAPEDPAIAADEREALGRGLEVLRRAVMLAARVPLDELLEEFLDRSGYRTHLLLLERKEEALANIQRFVRLLEQYRRLPLGTFLEIWDRWADQDNGMPQAPLFSKDDDVVTLSTIHRAKGLEWPVVFLVDIDAPFAYSYFLPNSLWTDRVLGPLICPPEADRGARAQRLYGRAAVEEEAEEARLLYVAATRAKDRLVVAFPRGAKGHGKWVEASLPADSVSIVSSVSGVEAEKRPEQVSLAWLAAVERGEPSRLAAPLAEPPLRLVTSATELMTRARDLAEWRLKYRHGIIPPARFAPPRTEDVPAALRGELIHGVLERIEEEDELAAVLDETVSALDAPELEEALAPGSRYRAALEAEILRLLQSEEWQWYVDGEHYRELSFIHFAAERSWRVGTFDLYRPDDPQARVIDFKTHQIGAEETAEVALRYAIQADVYRGAGGIRGPTRVDLHFTAPNVVIQMEPSSTR